MKKIIYSFIALSVSLAAVSCDEWDQVVGNYSDPDEEELVTMTPNATIAEVKALYNGEPVHIEQDLLIGGQVISSDVSGNIYRSLYIQDETGGIEIKLGTKSISDDYKLGQWVYVQCEGLEVGDYNGMIQLGVEDPTGSYETAYMDVKTLIDAHVFKGKMDTPVSPVVLTESQIKQSENFGKYVTLNGLVYGDEIFCLWYPNPNGDTKSQSNRVFLSDETWGVTTWAMSANKFTEYLESGVWNTAKLGDGSKTVLQLKDEGAITAGAYAVSQYFKMGNTDVQIRTSGYSNFSDTEIDQDVLDHNASINITGILTNYRGSVQFTLIDLSGVQVVR